ncbi:hypothetical protein KBD61_02305 [Patescibacteria group bacterium]|nr:hypothetical protein [Patescibacteria group bacterium]MBP9709841.1 hypothetical protein [Patescibacteria group bacterium]
MGELYRPEATKTLPKKTAREYCGHMLTITEAEPLPFAVASFDLSPFGAKEELVRGFLTQIEIWALSPMIEDDFQDHAERRAWENTIPEEMRSYLDNENKISGNNLGCAVGAMQSLIKYTVTNSPIAALSPYIDTLNSYHAALGKIAEANKPYMPREHAAHLRAVEYVDTMARDVLKIFCTCGP